MSNRKTAILKLNENGEVILGLGLPAGEIEDVVLSADKTKLLYTYLDGSKGIIGILASDDFSVLYSEEI